MAVTFYCKCAERKKPVHERNWVVINRHCHYSAFNGYRKTYSQYSTVSCNTCNAVGRTKADYVSQLKDAP